MCEMGCRCHQLLYKKQKRTFASNNEFRSRKFAGTMCFPVTNSRRLCFTVRTSSCNRPHLFSNMNPRLAPRATCACRDPAPIAHRQTAKAFRSSDGKRPGDSRTQIFECLHAIANSRSPTWLRC